MNNIKMLYNDRTDISEGADVNRTSKSKECNICHYGIFQIKDLSLSRYHDLVMILEP